MKLELGKRIRALFQGRKVRREYQEFVKKLTEFQEELARIKGLRPLDGIVPFFRATSPWFDNRVEVANIEEILRPVNYDGRWDSAIDWLRLFAKDIRMAGREKYGWNRTDPGQEVTEDNVFLGDVYGLWTFSVRDWQKTENNPPQSNAHFKVPVRNYDVISAQAKGFMDYYTESMTRAISMLEEAARPLPPSKLMVFVNNVGATIKAYAAKVRQIIPVGKAAAETCAPSA